MLPLLLALPTLVAVALVASFSALDTDDSFQLRDVDCYGEDCLITVKTFLDGLEASPTHYEDWWRQANDASLVFVDAFAFSTAPGTSTDDATAMHDASSSLPTTCDAFSSLVAKFAPSHTCDANMSLGSHIVRDYVVFAALLCALAAALLSIPFVGVAGCLSHILLIVRTDLKYIVGSLMPSPADVNPPSAKTVLKVPDIDAPTPPAAVTDIDFRVKALLIASFGSLAALLVAASIVELAKHAELDEATSPVVVPAANTAEDVDVAAEDANSADDGAANDDADVNTETIENTIGVASAEAADVDVVPFEHDSEIIKDSETIVPAEVPTKSVHIEVEPDVVPIEEPQMDRDVASPVEAPELPPRASIRVRTHTAPGQLLLVPTPPLPAGAALPRILPLPPLRLPTVGVLASVPAPAPVATRAEPVPPAELPADVIYTTARFPMGMAQRPSAPEPVPAALPSSDVIWATTGFPMAMAQRPTAPLPASLHVEHTSTRAHPHPVPHHHRTSGGPRPILRPRNMGSQQNRVVPYHQHIHQARLGARAFIDAQVPQSRTPGAYRL
ncbi:hypothetical protein C8R43DRAFT_989200 [Mycena crocata]|nr:hypothetical protein C8R43DRAFT_989200 [Mycena crocata]